MAARGMLRRLQGYLSSDTVLAECHRTGVSDESIVVGNGDRDVVPWVQWESRERIQRCGESLRNYSSCLPHEKYRAVVGMTRKTTREPSVDKTSATRNCQMSYQFRHVVRFGCNFLEVDDNQNPWLSLVSRSDQFVCCLTVSRGGLLKSLDSTNWSESEPEGNLGRELKF